MQKYNENPICNDTGICVAPAWARDITECVYCGKELHEIDGQWYTHDADLKNGKVRPQSREPQPKNAG